MLRARYGYPAYRRKPVTDRRDSCCRSGCDGQRRQYPTQTGVTLRDVSRAFVLLKRGLRSRESDVIRHFGNATQERESAPDGNLPAPNRMKSRRSASPFSLLDIESVDALTFPGGQRVIFANNPVLAL